MSLEPLQITGYSIIFSEFNLPEEQQDFEEALNGSKYKNYLDDIWNNLFRSRHKHGYSNQRINELLEDPKCEELMDLLENIYKDVLE